METANFVGEFLSLDYQMNLWKWIYINICLRKWYSKTCILVSDISFENDFVNVLTTKKISDFSDVSIEEKKHSISRAPILVEGDVATDIEEVRSF